MWGRDLWGSCGFGCARSPDLSATGRESPDSRGGQAETAIWRLPPGGSKSGDLDQRDSLRIVFPLSTLHCPLFHFLTFQEFSQRRKPIKHLLFNNQEFYKFFPTPSVGGFAGDSEVPLEVGVVKEDFLRGFAFFQAIEELVE